MPAMNIRFSNRFTQLLSAASLCATASPGHSVDHPGVEQGVIEETGLRYREWNAEGALFRLTQRLPDQTRAFFLGSVI